MKKLILIALCLYMTACVPTPTPIPTTIPSATPETLGEPIAVIASLDGDVFIENPPIAQHKPGLMAPSAQSNQRPTAFQVIRNGTTLRVEEGGSITIVCFNDRVYRVTQQGRVTITPELCDSGTPLPEDNRTRIRPNNGRIRTGEHDESLVLEEEVRDPKCEYNRVPVILSPLDTYLLDKAPNIHWVEVSDAIEYILDLSSSTIYPSVVVDVEELTCVEDGQTNPNRICSLPWPEAWALSDGQRAFLTVSARTGIASKPRPSEKSSLRTLSTEDATLVQSEIEAIQTLDLDGATQNVLLAGLYMEHQLYEQALATYGQASIQQPAPVLHITRGDLYRRAELPLFAFNEYQTALDLLDAQEEDAATRAAANFGIGATYYNCQRYGLAEPHFVDAVDLYGAVGAEEELSAAEGALLATRDRLE